MAPTRVDDEENLYRSIRPSSKEYCIKDGELVFSHMAFNDAGEKPSVDRSSMRNNPSESKKGPDDGVVGILTANVRAVQSIKINPNSTPDDNKRYAVDAIHRPIVGDPSQPDNLAHCQIEVAPEFQVKSHFRKLKEALARLATSSGFMIEPIEKQG
ncbi:hypothetical protein [Thiomonas intermedia]|uniref:hypothetical protein n=1 Tax=Thiomonas intermedia TaxID=926 RepID=UPI0012AB30D2|nr:hypothetical protein [Thiomonas intermedia]